MTIKAKYYKRNNVYKWECPLCKEKSEVSLSTYENKEGREKCIKCNTEVIVKIDN